MSAEQTIVELNHSFQVRDSQGHLEVSFATRVEAEAWMLGYRTAARRSATLLAEAASALVEMVNV
jgi:hypothetical protein